MTALIQNFSARLLTLVGVLLAIATFGMTPVKAQASAEQQEAAREFIADISGRAFDALRDPNLTGEEQRQKFRDLLMEGVAIDYVAPFLLGRFRRDADEEQMAEYQRIFPDYIVGFYTDQLLKIGDEELRIVSTQPVGRSDIYVRTQLVRPGGGSPIAADWRVKPTRDGDLKIIDLKVEGVSIAETKKDEFASLISSRGFGGFLDQLRADAYRSTTALAE